MEYKSAPAFIKEISGRTVPGIAAVIGNIDSGSDLIHKGAFKKTIRERSSRVKHLWQHNFSDPPTAVIRELDELDRDEMPEELLKLHPEVTGGLLVVREYLQTARGDEILDGITKGAITEMSFGYDPVKYDFEEKTTDDGTIMVRNLREIRLWDTSDVIWGMNPLTSAAKSVVPFKDTGKAPEGDSWSAPKLGDFTSDDFEELSSAEKTRIASHYAWAASMPPDTMGDLKLPHHKAGTSGVGPSVWKGVSAAMGALMGARGGVDIPDADAARVYAHLSKHYDQFEKDPPPMKMVILMRASAQIGDYAVWDTVKAGRVLSSANLNRLKDAIAMLQDVLASAEPPDEEEEDEDDEKTDITAVAEASILVNAALTEKVIQRLRIAQRESYLILNQ